MYKPDTVVPAPPETSVALNRAGPAGPGCHQVPPGQDTSLTWLAKGRGRGRRFRGRQGAAGHPRPLRPPCRAPPHDPSTCGRGSKLAPLAGGQAQAPPGPPRPLSPSQLSPATAPRARTRPPTCCVSGEPRRGPEVASSSQRLPLRRGTDSPGDTSLCYWRGPRSATFPALRHLPCVGEGGAPLTSSSALWAVVAARIQHGLIGP